MNHEVISKNAVKDKSLSVVVKAIKERFFYLEEEQIERIQDQLPNNEWRLILVLM